MTGDAGKNVLPSADADFSTLDGHRNYWPQALEMSFRRPISGAFHLVAVGIELLCEITLAVD